MIPAMESQRLERCALVRFEPRLVLEHRRFYDDFFELRHLGMGRMKMTVGRLLVQGSLLLLIIVASASAQKPKRITDEDLPWPPQLPGKASVVTDHSDVFLQRPEGILDGVQVATAPPKIDFMFFPKQDYPGKPWSNWGDGTFANGKYYSAIGDHYAIGRGLNENGTGTAHVYEYDPTNQELRALVDVTELLALPEGHYTPGKIHSRVDLGSDGWLYYATHRGSPKAANDANHYQGDWILGASDNWWCLS